TSWPPWTNAAIVMRPNGPWVLSAPGCQGIICRRPPSSTEHLGVLSLVTDPNDYAGPATSPRPNGSGRSTRSGRRAGWLTCGRRRRVSRCYSDEAIEARYHTTVIALMELERRRMQPGAPPEQLSLEGLQ